MNFGKRLLHNVVDQKSEDNPTNIFVKFPKDSNLKDWITVDFRTLKRAVDRMSWWMKDLLENSKDSMTICYLGAPDLRYLLLAIASGKTRSKVRDSTISYITDCAFFLGDCNFNNTAYQNPSPSISLIAPTEATIIALNLG
jgi:hypothetical protein